MVSFTKRVVDYVASNFDVDAAEGYIVDGVEVSFYDWVDAYIDGLNENVSAPYGDDADELDVETIGEEILTVLTGSGIATGPDGVRIEAVFPIDDF